MNHRKDNHSAGFTLMELLLTMFILMIVTTVVATGFPYAKDAYDKVVLAANAEVVLSTGMSTLRNELGTAQNVTVNGTTVTYYNTTRGAESQIFLGDDEQANAAMLQRYADAAWQSFGDDAKTKAARLVAEETATQNMYVTYKSVKYENGIVTFEEFAVYRPGSETPLAETETFSIRVISEAGS